MRDVFLFVLILVFSASAASFAPSSESIGAVTKPSAKKLKVLSKPEPTSKSGERGELKEALNKIEVRCRSLETILQGLDEEGNRR